MMLVVEIWTLFIVALILEEICSFHLVLASGRINCSTRPRVEVIGEGGSCVRAEARAPASQRHRESDTSPTYL
jgi:hypothetical protein